MATFVFTYRAPRNYTPGSPDSRAAWTAWFESMDGHLQDIGNPVFERRTAGATGPETVLGGYSLITADDLESALTLAEGCPFVGAGGGVEVGELTVISREGRLIGEHQATA